MEENANYVKVAINDELRAIVAKALSNVQKRKDKAERDMNSAKEMLNNEVESYNKLPFFTRLFKKKPVDYDFCGFMKFNTEAGKEYNSAYNDFVYYRDLLKVLEEDKFVCDSDATHLLLITAKYVNLLKWADEE